MEKSARCPGSFPVHCSTFDNVFPVFVVSLALMSRLPSFPSPSSRRPSRKKRSPVLFLFSIVAGMVTASLLAHWILSQTGKERTEKNTPHKGVVFSRQKKHPEKQNNGGLQDNSARVICRVYTKEPGFYVFVDGEPARDSRGKWITTPCAVSVPPGTYQFAVVRDGFRDAGRLVKVTQETEIEFAEPQPAGEDDAGLLDAAYLQAPLAEPIPLLSLITPQQELDPYITPDGLSLYFVSDRDGIKAIYRATRQSPYHYFSEKPQLVEGTRGYDLPASPGLTADLLSVVYTNPVTGIIYAVSRETSAGRFTRKTTLQPRRIATAKWIAAQVIATPDAWQLYGLEWNRGKTRGFLSTARRKGRRRGLPGNDRNKVGDIPQETLLPLSEQSFSPAEPFNLRGFPPVLSRDGLRQYFFDGRELKRAVRRYPEEPFSEPELIATLNIEDYLPTPLGSGGNRSSRRSFSVTDDEQWLFYESGGDLFMLRIFDRPRSELLITGRPIPPKPARVAKVPEIKPPVSPQGKPKPKAVDPRTVPLPYPAFRQKLRSLLRSRDYAAALQWVQKGLADPVLKEDHVLLEWDREDVQRTAAFWSDVQQAAGRLRPGDRFYIGSARLTFRRLEKDVLVGASGGKEVRKPLRTMRLTDLVDIVDKKLGRDNPAVQLHVGCFWYYDGEGSVRSALLRLQRAGPAGREFVERLAGRELQQAQHEFRRENIGRALQRVNRIVQNYPKTRTAEEARTLIQQAYRKTVWQSQGPRQWIQKEGLYTAGAGNSPGSILRSPQPYENFELRLEWRSDIPNGQGGVYFRYPGSGSLTENAFKIQLSDDFGVPPDKFCTGSLFKIEAPLENAVRKRGEWNTLRLRVRGEEIIVTINGRDVLQTRAVSEKIPRKGYVALDGTLGGISYRRMLLYELPAVP